MPTLDEMREHLRQQREQCDHVVVYTGALPPTQAPCSKCGAQMQMQADGSWKRVDTWR
jgi:hypothetical protein